MITLITNGAPLNEISVKTLVGYMEYYHIPVRAIYLNGCERISVRLMREILALTDDSLLVGFSLMSKDVSILLPLIKRVREEQGTHVVWGGIHPTALPEESLQHCDFVCIGEGEEPLRQLYQSIASHKSDYSDIPNIGYHEEGHIRLNPVTYSPKSLDDLPFPDYKFANSYYLQGFRKGRQFERIPSDPVKKGQFFQLASFLFYSQRGCKLACTYCSNSLYHRLARTTCVKWYRYASAERIKKELKSHLENMPFIQSVGLNDDDLLERDIEQLEAIATFLKNDLYVTFNINATPLHVTSEKISVLANYGLQQVSMGVQSGSERILRDVYKRPVKNAQVLEAGSIIRQFYDVGVRADYGFILDNPFETNDDWRDSLRLLMRLPKPRTITLYSLAFFPGTALSEQALQRGFIQSLASHFDKMYHDDIRSTYIYFLFLINAQFDVSDKWNFLLLSDVMMKYRITFPLRYILGQSTQIYKAQTKVKHWIKSALPESFLLFLMKSLLCGKDFLYNIFRLKRR